MACFRRSTAWRTVLEKNQLSVISSLEYLNESFLRYIHGSDGFHPLLAFLLFLQQFAFAGDVAAVAFRSDILAERAHGLTGDDFATNRGLHGHCKLLPGDNFFQLGRER